MNLRDAFQAVDAPDTPDAQTPKRPDVQTLKRLDASTAKRSGVGTPKRRDAQTPERSSGAAAQPAGLALQGTAKSRHPDFEKKTLYLRAATCRRAGRKWEDASGGDFSDLVEMLLGRYAGGGDA